MEDTERIQILASKLMKRGERVDISEPHCLLRLVPIFTHILSIHVYMYIAIDSREMDCQRWLLSSLEPYYPTCGPSVLGLF